MGLIGVFEMEADQRAAAFARFYDREAPAVTRYARAALGSDTAAQDVCAEAFCHAWDAWRRFSGDDAAERAWIFRIARNQVIDQVRSSRRARTVPLDDSHGRAAPDLETGMALRAALQRLGKDDREILSLRGAGLSHAEIGRVQGRSEMAAKQAWHRALQRLRAHMVDD